MQSSQDLESLLPTKKSPESKSLHCPGRHNEVWDDKRPIWTGTPYNKFHWELAWPDRGIWLAAKYHMCIFQMAGTRESFLTGQYTKLSRPRTRYLRRRYLYRRHEKVMQVAPRKALVPLRSEFWKKKKKCFFKMAIIMKHIFISF